MGNPRSRSYSGAFNEKTCILRETRRHDRRAHLSCLLGIICRCLVLVNTGVDILPTMFDFAGIEKPARLPGRSLKQIALGQAPRDWREFVVVQNYMTQGGKVNGKIPKVKGRMVRSKSYKYCLYDHGTRREELFDMKNDRLETVNLAAKPIGNKILKRHRDYLRAFAEKYQDEIALDMLKQV